jgi:predicted RNA-binding protein (virulence factor B family)
MTTFAAIMELGVVNKLNIARHTDYGFFLEDSEQEEVLLPNAYVTNDMKVGDDIEVFIYKDSEDRIVATTETPKIKLDQFAFLKVVGVSQYGVFMDWGLPKDLMVPYAEQTKEMEEGTTHLVFLTIDEQTDRLIGSAKVNDFLFFDDIKLEVNQEVDLVLYDVTDLGVMCIVDNLYRGMIFHSDIHRDIRVGEELRGFVKQIREDGKIDISLTPIGYKASVDPHSQLILDKLNENNGFLAMNDKSDPELINKEFGISKKAFKRAIGNLYKQKLILLENDGIVLV